MWMPRVKIKINSLVENLHYKKDQWIKGPKFKKKCLYYKFDINNYIEFVICFYETREEALMDGKILYFNILFNGYYSFLNYEMGDARYIIRMYHEGNGYTCKEFTDNEEWFYSTKKYYANFIGLQIYEVDSLEDYNYYQTETVKLQMEYDKPLDLIEYLNFFDYDCIYSDKVQPIFNLFRLVEEADNETKILLLCQILETMGDNKHKSDEATVIINDLKKTVDDSELELSEKQSIVSGLENLKWESSRKKIRRLITKYNDKTYAKFNKNKLINECYRLRSKITHGDELNNDERNQISSYTCDLKHLTLDIFKEWSKEL